MAKFGQIVRFSGVLNKYLVHLPVNHQSKRYFFGIITTKTKEYENRKLVGYSSDQMFEVVSDVSNYHKFIPFCKKSDIMESRSDYLKASLQIGFPPIVESYTSKVTLSRPYLVKAVCSDGRLFNELVTVWRFSPGLKTNPQTCIIDFYIQFEFRNLVHFQLANMFFEKLCNQMEKAFIAEAKCRFGQASLPSHPLTVVKA